MGDKEDVLVIGSAGPATITINKVTMNRNFESTQIDQNGIWEDVRKNHED